MVAKYAALVLSRGEQFQPQPLIPIVHGYTQWPADAEVYTRFYDSGGGKIIDIYGATTTTEITFSNPPEEVDIVPEGAPYETFLIDDEQNIKMLRYGQVIRRQAMFFNPPSTDTVNAALQFRDNFYSRKGLLGPKWFVTQGALKIFDNTAISQPNGVGPNPAVAVAGAMRYQAELNTDSWTLSFNMIFPALGDTAICVGCNTSMTSYMFVRFHDTGTPASRRLQMGVGAGPLAMAQQVPEVSHAFVNNTNYKLRYDNDTRKLELLNSAMTTSLISWTDSASIVPHGQGYRYFGANFQDAVVLLFANRAPQLTQIAAQDGLTFA